MWFSGTGTADMLRDIAQRFAGDGAPVRKRHRIAAGLVLCGALVLPIALTFFLDARTALMKRLFDIPCGGLGFLAACLLLFVGWLRLSIVIRKWFVAALLNALVIAVWLALLAARLT